MDSIFEIFEFIDWWYAMNIVSLRTFLAIVKTGSLVRASEMMNVTQSTVTARLKALETELGQTLITRHKNGARLTAAGIRLRRYAEAMTQLWTQARQEAALPSSMSGLCNIGCETGLWEHCGSLLLDAMRQNAPTMAVSAWHGSDTDNAEWLANGLVDVAIMHRVPPAPSGLQTYALPSDRLVLVASRPDAPTRHDAGYIYVELGTEFERQHTRAYADADTAKLSYSHAGWALSHLLTHGGSAYLPERIVAQDIASGRLFLLADAPVFIRPAYLIIRDPATTHATIIAQLWSNLLDQLSAVSVAPTEDSHGDAGVTDTR